MADGIGATEQSALCLCCGAPFVSRLDASDTISLDRGYLSLLWMNSKARSSARMIRMFEHPRLTNTVQRAHIFHTSHHQTALAYATRVQRGDRDTPEPGQRSRLNANPLAPPLAYEEAPTSRTAKNPRVAFWDRPPQASRLDMGDLAGLLLGVVHASPDPAQLGRAFDPDALGLTCPTCVDCNAVMTQERRFMYLLHRAGARLVADPAAVQVRAVTTRQHPSARDGLAHWVQSGRDQLDNGSLAPLLAYYLHACLPWPGAGTDDDYFRTMLPPPQLAAHPALRALFLQQCWLVLEVACLCGTLRRSTQPGEPALSCGYKSYLGALDLYASFFCWRLFEFEHLGRFSASLDFEQWHQKYFTCAARCRGLRLPRGRTIGEWVDPGDLAPRALVQRVQQRLVQLYRERLRPLCDFLVGAPVPNEVSLYFVHPRRLRLLVGLSRRFPHADFDAALAHFGVRALTYRMLDLCRRYPEDVVDMLKDFATHWSWREVGNLQSHHPWIDARTATVWYDLAQLVVRPDEIPMDRTRLQALKRGPKCSPWASVPTLLRLGAFSERGARRG